MTERPILFSTPMVKAILDGRKTMTRRAVSKNNSHCGSMPFNVLDLSRAFSTISFGNQSILKAPIVEEDGTLHRIWHKREVGDRLWVRETWQGTKDCISYKASDPQQVVEFNYEPWRPSIFMPRWASRITLEITNVRVERLQDISAPDCVNEGINTQGPYDVAIYDEFSSHSIAQFAYLWDSINSKKYPWESNPWVWVIEFKRLEKI
jgi:hypothetical protein